MLKALLFPFLKLDEYALKYVTKAMIWLMQTTGWSKTIIRYALLSIQILVLIALAACALQVPPISVWGFIGYGFMVAICLLSQKIQRDQDTKDSEQGIVSTWPNNNGWQWLWWMWLPFDIARATGYLNIPKEWLKHAHLWHVYSIFELAFTITGLLCIYSSAAPPKPPAKAKLRVLIPVPIRQT